MEGESRPCCRATHTIRVGVTNANVTVRRSISDSWTFPFATTLTAGIGVSFGNHFFDLVPGENREEQTPLSGRKKNSRKNDGEGSSNSNGKTMETEQAEEKLQSRSYCTSDKLAVADGKTGPSRETNVASNVQIFVQTKETDRRRHQRERS